MTAIGKEFRLGNLFNKHSGNSIMVAMDHGDVVGPVHGIKNPRETVKNSCTAKLDTSFMPIGIIKRVYTEFIKNDIPFIASIDTCAYLGPEPDYFILADTVEHALSVGACGVSVHVLVGLEKTSEMLTELVIVAINCDAL